MGRQLICGSQELLHGYCRQHGHLSRTHHATRKNSPIGDNAGTTILVNAIGTGRSHSVIMPSPSTRSSKPWKFDLESRCCTGNQKETGKPRRYLNGCVS
jgi:hypothetical protein